MEYVINITLHDTWSWKWNTVISTNFKVSIRIMEKWLPLISLVFPTINLTYLKLLKPVFKWPQICSSANPPLWNRQQVFMFMVLTSCWAFLMISGVLKIFFPQDNHQKGRHPRRDSKQKMFLMVATEICTVLSSRNLALSWFIKVFIRLMKPIYDIKC